MIKLEDRWHWTKDIFFLSKDDREYVQDIEYRRCTIRCKYKNLRREGRVGEEWRGEKSREQREKEREKTKRQRIEKRQKVSRYWYKEVKEKWKGKKRERTKIRILKLKLNKLSTLSLPLSIDFKNIYTFHEFQFHSWSQLQSTICVKLNLIILPRLIFCFQK